MRRWASVCLACVITAGVVGSVHGQINRQRTGAPVSNGAPAATPSGGAVTVNIYPQLLHVRFTKAVTAPTPVGQDQDIRAHLENPLMATVGNSTQKAVVLPSDIDVNLSVRLEQADPQNKNARLRVQVMSANVDPAEGRRRFFSAEVSHLLEGWPKPGDILIPAGSTLSIPHFGGSQPMGQAQLATTDPNASRADDSFPSRPILPVDLPIALVDQPIDVTNAGSNTLFRAQLTDDMQFLQSGTPLPAGAIKLSKGTEVYVRSYEPDPSAPLGHFASWSVVLVVINGRIPVRGLELRTPFAPGSMAISEELKRKVPMVLWPLGQTRQYKIAEQQEVMSNGTTLWTYPTTSNLAPASTQPSTAIPNTPASPPNPNAPPATAAPPAIPTPIQQQLDERRKQAQEMRACQQQAIKDHPAGSLELAQAVAACNPRQRK